MACPLSWYAVRRTASGDLRRGADGTEASATAPMAACSPAGCPHSYTTAPLCQQAAARPASAVALALAPGPAAPSAAVPAATGPSAAVPAATGPAAAAPAAQASASSPAQPSPARPAQPSSPAARQRRQRAAARAPLDALALHAHLDLVERVVHQRGADGVAPLLGSQQRRLVDEVGQVGAAEACVRGRGERGGQRGELVRGAGQVAPARRALWSLHAARGQQGQAAS
jgi:hypothetical protein